MAKRDRGKEYYDRFASRIIRQIEAGTAPWQRPWKPGEPIRPENLVTKKAYRGGNSVYLAAAQMAGGYADNRWATYRQIAQAGGHVWKGERGEPIAFFTRTARVLERDKRGKPRVDAEGKKQYRTIQLARPAFRVYTVFNAEQTRGIDLSRPQVAKRADWEAHQAAEAVIAASKVDVKHVPGDKAAYNPKRDQVVLPTREQFRSADGYYGTALHELGHATGHPDRMNRETFAKASGSGFGSEDYAREELRAEISAMMTGERVGVGHNPQHGAAYVQSWVKALQEDPREIYRASAEAQRISDYLIELARARIQEIAARRTGPENGPARGPQRSPQPSPLPVPPGGNERLAAVPAR